MNDVTKRLIDALRAEILDLRADVERLRAAGCEAAALRDEVARLKDGHCKDCCCARSWAALGIHQYTGRSIPEEIEMLRDKVTRLEAAGKSLADEARGVLPVLDSWGCTKDREGLEEAIQDWTDPARPLPEAKGEET